LFRISFVEFCVNRSIDAAAVVAEVALRAEVEKISGLSAYVAMKFDLFVHQFIQWEHDIFNNSSLRIWFLTCSRSAGVHDFIDSRSHSPMSSILPVAGSPRRILSRILLILCSQPPSLGSSLTSGPCLPHTVGRDLHH